MKDHVAQGRTGRLIVAKHRENSFVLDSCRPSFFHTRHTLRSVIPRFSRVSRWFSQGIPPSMEKTITQFDGENDGKARKTIEFRQERQESPAGGQCAVRGGKCSVFRGRWGPTDNEGQPHSLDCRNFSSKARCGVNPSEERSCERKPEKRIYFAS